MESLATNQLEESQFPYIERPFNFPKTGYRISSLPTSTIVS
jgi:hypothetical protein